MVPDFRVLCVSTYDRTRSPLIAALLRAEVARRELRLDVATAGIVATGGRVTYEVSVHLQSRDIDVQAHRAQLLLESHVRESGLVLTTDPEHVTNIVSRWPEAYPKTFTMCELVALAGRVGGRLGDALSAWTPLLHAGRPPIERYPTTASGVDHLRLVEPPSGDRDAWTQLFDTADELCQRLVKALD
ncbi:MAG: hypothetical protein KDB40_03360 [Acidimicrobiales bacterium]|nr:hypothetical protein [Acidimicrobiales bacterium]MCB9392596.1 hypothetical protein [Acidimicrobiaceae bacterium]